MTFERIGKQILAHGFHYADVADETAAQFVLETLQAKATRAPHPLAEEMLGVLRSNVGTMEEQVRRCIRWGKSHVELGYALGETRALLSKVEEGGVPRDVDTALRKALIASTDLVEELPTTPQPESRHDC